jgi:hypothetical protein
MPRKSAPKKPPRGIRMTPGSRWNLEAQKGRERHFLATLLDTFIVGGKRIAIFSVPARPREQRERKT